MPSPITGTANVTNRVDPISRIEGHLGVNLQVSGGSIIEADAHGNLWRGFENFLLGRQPNDAITFTQRICGVCPVPHGMASTYAVESVLGYNSNMFQTGMIGAPGVASGEGVPAKALHVRNLILAAEFLMSSITHFYHLAAPSYVQGPNIPPWTPYFADTFYYAAICSPLATVPARPTRPTPARPVSRARRCPLRATNGFSEDLWSAVIKSYVKALRIRRLTFEAGALFAGRMPMTSAYIAGGVGFDKNVDLTDRIDKFNSLIGEVGKFIIKEYVPITLALGALYGPYDNVNNTGAPTGAGQGFGDGTKNMLAWGAFPQSNGVLGLSRGYKFGAGRRCGHGHLGRQRGFEPHRGHHQLALRRSQG